MSRATTMVLLAVIGAAPAAAQPAPDISHNQSIGAGAGPALSTDRTTYARRINDVPETGSSALNSIGVHALTEIDVRATSRLSVFAGLRIDLRDLRYLESSFGYPAVGLRFAF